MRIKATRRAVAVPKKSIERVDYSGDALESPETSEINEVDEIITKSEERKR